MRAKESMFIAVDAIGKGTKRPYLAGVLVLGSLLGCDNPLAPYRDGIFVRIDHLVTGEAHAALDPRGRFQFRWTDPRGGVIPIDSLKLMAEALTRSVAHEIVFPGMLSVKEALEAAYGGPIDFEAAEAASRSPYLIESPYPPLPDSVPLAYRHYWGDFYAVPTLVNKVEIATVLVARDTPARLKSSGFIEPVVGNDLNLSSVPFGRGSTLVPPPEEVVRYAATATGRRVARVPRLLAPGRQIGPQMALWEITFEAPAPVSRKDDQREMYALTVYVTQFGLFYGATHAVGAWSMFIAAEDQPEFETILYATEHGIHYLEWPLRPGHPRNLIEVTF